MKHIIVFAVTVCLVLITLNTCGGDSTTNVTTTTTSVQPAASWLLTFVRRRNWNRELCAGAYLCNSGATT